MFNVGHLVLSFVDLNASFGEHYFHFFLIESLSKVWPEFKNWHHACGGHSSGAKGSFFRLAQLLKADANAVGGFFSGCNGCYAEMAGQESKLRKSAWRKVKGFQSTGDQDKLVEQIARFWTPGMSVNEYIKMYG